MEGGEMILILEFVIFGNKVAWLISFCCKISQLMYFMLYQVNESLFPCALSSENAKLAEEVVQFAVKTWGPRSLTELEAEERLSYSCEKVNSS